MNDMIVSSLTPLTLVGGGEACMADLTEALTIAPTCVAADAGAMLALKAGVPIAALIGDFDSISETTLAQIPCDRQFRIDEQDTTDFDKALRNLDTPLVIGVGFCGGRLDHQLAVLHTLVRHAHRRCILLAESQIVLLAPPKLEVATMTDDVVSIFPLGPTQGRSDGLEWPINGLDLNPLSQIGTSNRAVGPARIEMDSPHAILMLPRRIIRQVAEALLHPDAAGWPPPE
ncbi:hypothetical protein LCGC14_0687060 [marine sediment metagenome]|uniref:Thiamin pyrophosphokinase thiamin-binding domain-containing protein n=1 Tax=marine sediment metagenome TaxID=412755 RepID=A0A0F9TUH5_9ZZZZ